MGRIHQHKPLIGGIQYHRLRICGRRRSRLDRGGRGRRGNRRRLGRGSLRSDRGLGRDLRSGCGGGGGHLRWCLGFACHRHQPKSNRK